MLFTAVPVSCATRENREKMGLNNWLAEEDWGREEELVWWISKKMVFGKQSEQQDMQLRHISTNYGLFSLRGAEKSVLNSYPIPWSPSIGSSWHFLHAYQLIYFTRSFSGNTHSDLQALQVIGEELFEIRRNKPTCFSSYCNQFSSSVFFLLNLIDSDFDTFNLRMLYLGIHVLCTIHSFMYYK